MIESLLKRIGRWLRIIPRVEVASAKAGLLIGDETLDHPNIDIDLDLSHGEVHPVPYDENLLERARTQWQFGDWESLAKLDRNTLQHHPDRAKLALLAAAGHQQNNDMASARQFIRLAQDWGCSRRLISQILIAGVHNTLGRAAASAGQIPRALEHFESSIVVGAPGSDVRLLAQARSGLQLEQLGSFSNLEVITALAAENDSHNRRLIAGLDAIRRSARSKPIVRTIHHFSCTGGTLFAKCIAAQPNVVVMNEVDPFSALSLNDASGRRRFTPRDTISLLIQSGESFSEETIAEIFLNDIEIVLKNLSKQQKYLVLRDHVHSAYLQGASIRNTGTLRNILCQSFEVRPVVTVRNPIDSYLSLKKLKWIHYDPPGFDEYCRRYLRFLEDYEDVRIFRYEDLIKDATGVMQSICTHLELDYCPNFINEFKNFNFSGDSGRAGDVIEPRPRRTYGEDFVAEVNGSINFKLLAQSLEYESELGL